MWCIGAWLYIELKGVIHSSSPASPDYIPGPEDPQTPPVPQDEDEREPMFVQAHDPDYVPEPIYPEYIPLEDEHEFPAEEQPLPPVDSPTAESPGYVTESDPEEDPEEYEDDETEDGPVDYPMDEGDDGDDDDGDSSRDDANDEDEDDEDEEEEEEEHLAPADSTIVVPVDEPVFPPEGTKPVIPPPSTDITIGARITVRPQTSISLPPEAEVERLLAMTTPSPSPPISLSPPFAGERLARIASTQALIDAVTAALPSPPLPPLPPSLYIPPPVDHRDEIPESEQPPRKRLCLSTLDSRYEVGESSTTRPTRGRDIDYGFVSTVDAEERRQWIRDVGYGIRDTWVDPAEAEFHDLAPYDVEEVNTRVTELAELHEHDTQDLYALLEDAQDSRSRISQRVDMDSQRVDLLMGDRMTLQETVWMVEEEAYASREAWAHSIGLSQATHQELQTHHDHVYAHETHLQAHQTQLQLQGTLIQTQHQELFSTARAAEESQMPGPEARIPNHQDASGMLTTYLGSPTDQRGPNTPVNNANPNNMTPESIQAMIDQALLRNSTNGDGSHNSPEDNRRNGTEAVVGLTRWIEKMEPVFNISGCAIENQVKFATCTLLEVKGENGCSTLPLKRFKKKLTLICTKFIANETEKVDKYISGLPDNIYGNVKSARPKTLDETIELANDLMDQKLRTYAEWRGRSDGSDKDTKCSTWDAAYGFDTKGWGELCRSIEDLQLSREELGKLLPKKWITNYEQIHQAPVCSTSAPEFVRHENGLVEIKFSSSQPKSDNVFPIGIHMIAPTDQEPSQEVKDIWWDVCNCESFLDEAAKFDDDDEDLPKKRKSSQQKLKRRYEKGDPTVGLLGDPLGKFYYYEEDPSSIMGSTREQTLSKSVEVFLRTHGSALLGSFPLIYRPLDERESRKDFFPVPLMCVTVNST
ncbi:hypothetical protein Tco_1391205 [Tanacetum coccineum]